MANYCLRRIHEDLMELYDDSYMKPFEVAIIPAYCNIHYLHGYLPGPDGTNYQGGRFRVELDIPYTYPFDPPKVTLNTPIWHPNFCAAGSTICVDFLQHQPSIPLASTSTSTSTASSTGGTISYGWRASYTLRTILLSLQSYLGDPQPEDSYELEAAEQLINTPDIFDLTAQYWTYHFAIDDGEKTVEQRERWQEYDEHVATLTEDTFGNTSMAVMALSWANWDVELAAELLPVVHRANVERSMFQYPNSYMLPYEPMF